MKKSLNRRTMIERVIPLLALITAIPFAQAADPAQCPNPRPQNFSVLSSDGQWYACSHDELADAEKQLNIEHLLDGCLNKDCVQAKANAIANNINNSTWAHGDADRSKQLLGVQSALRNLTGDCPSGTLYTSTLEGCIKANSLEQQASVVKQAEKETYQAVQDIAAGKQPQRDQALSSARAARVPVQNKAADLRAARAAIFSTMAGNKEPQPDGLRSCHTEDDNGHSGVDSNDCVNEHIMAAKAYLSKYPELKPLIDNLQATANHCKTSECFSDATQSAVDAINGKYDLDKGAVAGMSPEAASVPAYSSHAAQVSQPSHATQAIKTPTKWSEMNTTDKISWFKAKNAADAAANQQLYIKYQKASRGCSQSVSGVFGAQNLMMPDADGISSISKILTAPDLGASKVRAPAAAPTIQYDDFDDQVE